MGSIAVEDKQHTQLPVIDLSPFLQSSSDQERLHSAEELVKACKEIGFCFIKGHGVPQDKIQEAFAVSKKFYALPQEEKMKAPHPPGWAVHRGYSWPGLEKVSNAVSENDAKDEADKLREVQDFKESYEVGSEDNPDMPNVWPPDEVLPEWRPCMTAFYWTCWEAAQNILKALALGLGIEEKLMMEPHSGHHNQLRLLHYPPIRASELQGGKFARMPAHTDWTTITMLFQDDCGGLQVESPTQRGTFIDADPVPDTLVLNVGDLLMRWSNDYLKSTQHRVQPPPLEDRYEGEQRMTRARYSIPYFVTTDPDVTIECLRLQDGRPPQYEPITQRDYSDMRARMQY
ncbi:hypothetical protein PMZ80_000581 [Knufia obscura]|nr:hypothetical protein PMZ80_000581 [Knufia obscura]